MSRTMEWSHVMTSLQRHNFCSVYRVKATSKGRTASTSMFQYVNYHRISKKENKSIPNEEKIESRWSCGHKALQALSCFFVCFFFSFLSPKSDSNPGLNAILFLPCFYNQNYFHFAQSWSRKMHSFKKRKLLNSFKDGLFDTWHNEEVY